MTASGAAQDRDCARRGMRAPVLAVGDGALGFRKALAEVVPEVRHQRCSVHKTVSVVDALPKSAQPAAKRAIQEIYNAEDKEHAARAVRGFERAYQAIYPKVVKWVTGDEDELLASSTILPSTGSICAPQIRSSRPLRRSGCGRRSPRAPAAGEPPSPWSSS